MNLSRNKIKKLYKSKKQSAKNYKNKKNKKNLKKNKNNFSKKRKGGKNLRAKTFKKIMIGGKSYMTQFHKHELKLEDVPDKNGNLNKNDIINALNKSLNGNQSDNEKDRYKSFKDYLNSNDNNVFKEDAFDNIGILTNLVNKANIGGDIGELNLKDGFLGGKYKFKAAILWDSSEKSMSIKENEYEKCNNEHKPYFNFLIKDKNYNNLMHMASDDDLVKNNFYKSINYHTDGGKGGIGGSYKYANEHICKMLLSKNKDCDTPFHKLFKNKLDMLEYIIYPHFTLDVWRDENIKNINDKELNYEKRKMTRGEIGSLQTIFIETVCKLIWGKK